MCAEILGIAMRGDIHLQHPDVMQQLTGWLTRIAGPVMEPVLHEYCNAQTHIAQASALSPIQVLHLAMQAHVPYARTRHRHPAFAHYARNLCNQFAHCQAYRLCTLSRNIYTHAAGAAIAAACAAAPRGARETPLPKWPVTRSEKSEKKPFRELGRPESFSGALFLLIEKLSQNEEPFRDLFRNHMSTMGPPKKQ